MNRRLYAYRAGTQVGSRQTFRDYKAALLIIRPGGEVVTLSWHGNAKLAETKAKQVRAWLKPGNTLEITTDIRTEGTKR